MRRAAAVALFLVLPFAPQPARGAPAPSESGAEAIGRRFVDELSAGEWEAATEPFTDRMREGLPPARLAALWRALETRLDGFDRIEGASSAAGPGGGRVVWIRTRFVRGAVLIEVTVDEKRRIASFFVRSAAPTIE